MQFLQPLTPDTDHMLSNSPPEKCRNFAYSRFLDQVTINHFVYVASNMGEYCYQGGH